MTVETSEVVRGWTMQLGASLLLSGLKPPFWAAAYAVASEVGVRMNAEGERVMSEQAEAPVETAAEETAEGRVVRAVAIMVTAKAVKRMMPTILGQSRLSPRKRGKNGSVVRRDEGCEES